jgi:hypothetical protein
LLNIVGEEVPKEKMKNFFFSLKPVPMLNPMKGIEACGAGIISNKEKDNHVNPVYPV